MKSRWIVLFSLISFSLLLPQYLLAGNTGYLTPPKAIADLVDTPRFPGLALAPNRRMLLLLQQSQLPSLAEVAREEKRLAGIRFNPKNHGPSRSRAYMGLTLVNLDSGAKTVFQDLPEAPILGVSWSPDSRYIAMTVAKEKRVELWLISVEEGKARLALDAEINAVIDDSPIHWEADGSLLTLTVPESLKRPATTAGLPNGPNVQETSGTNAAVRTYQDLLANTHDEEIFSYFLTSQVTRVNIDGSSSNLGKSALITNLDCSPDGNYLTVTYIQKPFSYLVPYWRFPKNTDVWHKDGSLAHTVAKLPLAENIPKGFDATREGPRRISWRNDQGATLVWVEAQDGGNPDTEAKVRDAIFMQSAPFKDKARVIARIASRYNDITWGNGFALLEEDWWRTRQTKTWVIDPENEEGSKLLFERSSEDRYSDPGSPLMIRNKFGRRIINQTLSGALLYAGIGASEKGFVPFVERRDLKTGSVERTWEASNPYFEFTLSALDSEGETLLIRRESPNEPPNLFLKNKGKMEALTNYVHPNPDLISVKKEIISYSRADGVKLSGTLYLPPGYKKEDGPLPTVLWAYPVEYKSAKAAGQMRTSPYKFTNISYHGPLPYLTMGYAVLDNPTMPLIGEGDTQPNDTFRSQLVESAKAAVEELTRRGVTDPDRVAVAGHSYGAFMVANLLAHSDLFRAGIARSGAYNRTLTPFGFQSEERSFWEAQDVYGAMSPFFHAEKINEPILFIHGEADNNSGTFPMQSERMFHAIKGLGGTARLVLLPYESHGYRARESVLHMLAEQLNWLETHVKNAPARTTKDPS